MASRPRSSRTSSRCAATRPTGLPGAPGIGAKTAAALLERHGSLEAAIAAAGEERPRVAAALQGAAAELEAFKLIAQLQQVTLARPADAPTDLAGGAQAAERLGLGGARAAPASGGEHRPTARLETPRRLLARGRELDGDHVAVGDEVVTPLKPQARRAHARQRSHPPRTSASQETTSARTKPRWMSLWICTRGMPDREPAAQMPGLCRLVLAGGEERDQRTAAAKAPRTTRCKPDSLRPRSARSATASSASQLSQLRLEPRRDGHRAGPLGGRVRSDRRRAPRCSPSSTLATNSTGLAGERAERRSLRIRCLAARGTVHAGRPAWEGVDQLAESHAASASAVAGRRSWRCWPLAGADAPPARDRHTRQLGLDGCHVGRMGRHGGGAARRSRSGGRGRRERARRFRRMFARNWLPRPSPRCAPATARRCHGRRSCRGRARGLDSGATA